MKTDSLGRKRQATQSNGSKKIPQKSHGSLTGVLSDDDMPPGLALEAQEFWLWARRQMEALGIAEQADGAVLTLAAERHGDMMDARQAIRDEGSTVMDDNGNRKRNPNWITLEKAAAQKKALLGDLGLTPSARAKLGGKAAELDAFEQISQAGKTTPFQRHA